jgi:hypothetical protein
MKAQFLKIAKVKSEKEFYKKYPTEAAFFKAHPEAKKQIKKAKIGTYIGGDTIPNAEMIDFNEAYANADKQVTGMNNAERQKAAYDQAMLQATQAQAQAQTKATQSAEGDDDGGGEEGGGGLMSMLGGMFGGGDAEYGARIPKAQAGTNVNNWWSNIQPSPGSKYPSNVSQTYGIGAQTMGRMGGPAPVNQPGTQGSYGIGGTNYAGPATYSGPPANDFSQGGNGLFKNPGYPQAGYQPNSYSGYQGEINQGPDNTLSDKLGDLKPMLGPLGDLIGGIDALKGEKEAAARAKQQRMLSELQLKASTTRPEMKERKYVRPEDVVNTGEAFFPIYGVGTNVLAKNGVKLQGGGMIGGNPTEIQNTYGIGYVPLIDFDQQKSFYYGGSIPKAQGGFSQRMQNWGNSISGGGSGFSGGGSGGWGGWGAAGGMATNIGNTLSGGPNAGGDIGGTLGGSIGGIFGPAGNAIGKFTGTMIGKSLDPYAGAIKRDSAATRRNVENLAMNQMAPGIQAQYSAHVRNGGVIANYEDGGYMNPEYNPQVITMFGDHNAQDFADYAHKDQYRAGGHLKSYTAPSERAMEIYKDGGEVRRSALNGEVKTTWGGGVRTLSHNPYMPATGETIEFVGNSHDEYDPGSKQTGIGVKYGKGNQDSYTDYAEYGTEQADANVEVEKEPAAELIDPATGDKNLTVYGNLKIPNQFVSLLGDPDAKGMKFKHYVTKLSKLEEKQNEKIATATNELNKLDVNSSFDRLKLSSLEATITGGNMKLKDIADKKINAASLQNAINDTAEENGLVADDLARGKIKFDKEAMTTREARLGAAISKAKDGATTTTKDTTQKPVQFTSIEEAKKAGFVQDAKGNWYKPKDGKKKTTTEKKSASAMDTIPKQSVDKSTGLFGGITPAQFEAYKKRNSWYPNWDKFDPRREEDVDDYAKAFNAEAEKRGSKARILPDDKKTGKTKYIGKQFTSAKIEDVKETEPAAEEQEYANVTEPGNVPVQYKRSGLIDFGNQLLDYLRPSDQEPFDYQQLFGEMYALSNNQLDPVQAQLYRPQLNVPYDISYQDMLNENQADFNAQTRQIGYNPAAQANLNANKYMANQKVLAEQFRANQAMKAGVYADNINTLNQAKLANLNILDKQYERQSQAVSNTKATAQAALSSISDKYAKQKLENRTLGVYENLYKYRFDNKGRAINLNGIFQPNIPIVGSTTGTQKQVPIYKADGKTIDHYQLEEMTPQEILEAQQQQNQYVAVPPSSILPIQGGAQKTTKKNSRNGSIVKAIKNL